MDRYRRFADDSRAAGGSGAAGHRQPGCKGTKFYPCAGPTGNAYLYSSAANTWSVTGSMHYSRSSHTMTVLPNGQVLVAGGFSHPFPGYLTPLSSAELYSP